MKIYVSDDIYEYLAIGKRDIHSGVDDDLVVKSLEQHEAEIRKPLEDEIERLKNKVRILHNTAQVTDKNYMEQIPNLKKEEREKVIAELEEWASYKINDYDTSIPRLEMINSFIKKLNEMKGE